MNTLTTDLFNARMAVVDEAIAGAFPGAELPARLHRAKVAVIDHVGHVTEYVAGCDACWQAQCRELLGI